MGSGLIKKLNKTIMFASFLSLFIFISGCHAMKKIPPENFFSGKQLSLAQEIERGNTNGVIRHADGVDLNRPGKEDMTLLFFALQNAFGEKEAQLKIMTELVKLGANPLQQVPDMGSVAEVVAKSDSPLYMNALLEGGMNPNALVEETPIIFDTATDHSFEVLKLLVAKGADVNQRDSLGQNVLIEALASMQLDQVEWLLNHGASPKIVTVNGWQFGNMLENSIKREGDVSSTTGSKLDDIRKLAISKGMKWPPLDQ